jgi:hypothetical protein
MKIKMTKDGMYYMNNGDIVPHWEYKLYRDNRGFMQMEKDSLKQVEEVVEPVVILSKKAKKKRKKRSK